MNLGIKRQIKDLLRALIVLIAAQYSISVQAADQGTGGISKTDVRVIIDVSGSMKKNDPENLRVPALKLLVGLLPEDVKAGVWTFGTKVKPLIKHGDVTKQWKNRANKSVKKITSHDMFTNVESALKSVTRDWDETDPDTKRNIILLTDGMVDVSKNQAKSDASRQRILDEVLLELQNKGVTVHTIALSENADQEIMEALAVGTDGWSEQVNNAEQLQRVFLHMFEKSTPRDTVPLKDNQFTIDKMIEEFTLLVFRNKDSKESTVIPPAGEKFTQKTRPKNVAWLEEAGYDLITITKPVAGEWKVDADIDPDNRVMVVTKLKLQTMDIPDSVFLGETYDYKFWLTAAGKTIKKDAFYNLLEIKMLQTSNGKIQQVWDLEQRNLNNEYVHNLGESFSTGKLELSVVVDGKTFKRQHKQTINVHQQFYEVDLKPLQKIGGKKIHVIHVIPEDKLVDLSAFQVMADVTAPDGSLTNLHGKMVLRGNEWLVKIEDPLPGQYSVVLETSAKTASGREVSVKGAPLKIGEPVAEEQITDEGVLTDDITEETNWVQIGMILLTANVILFGLIGGVWFFLKKRTKNISKAGEDL